MKNCVISSAALGLVLCGCSAVQTTQPVEISFAVKSGGKPAACNELLTDLGSSGSKTQLSDARFYVHDVSLLDDQGRKVPVQLSQSAWQYAGVVLLDFEDATGACKGTKQTNTSVIGEAPKGNYVGLSFVVGVPLSGKDANGKEVRLNHSGAMEAPPPLDVLAMSWPWQAGRKFMKIEMDPEKGVARSQGKPGPTWYLHLGSTGCKGDPVKGEAVACGNPNRIPLVFPTFDPARQRVVLDLKPLFAKSDLEKDQGMAIGCMSGIDDPDCPGVFEQMGLSFKETQPGAGNGGHPLGDGSQSKIFKVEAKP